MYVFCGCSFEIVCTKLKDQGSDSESSLCANSDYVEPELASQSEVI